MQADQVIWFVAGGMAVLVVLFVLRFLRQPEGDQMTFPSPSGDRQPSPPICFAGQVPYGVDKRSMPSGDDLGVLLPTQVGSFVRGPIRVPKDIHRDPIYAEYQCGGSTVFVELGICGTPSGSQGAIMNAKRETDTEFFPMFRSGVR